MSWPSWLNLAGWSFCRRFALAFSLSFDSIRPCKAFASSPFGVRCLATYFSPLIV